MSLKSFFKNLFSNIAAAFTKLLPKLKKAIKVGVEVTEAIKNFDEKNGAVVDILTAIIPGNIDDTVKNAIRAKLPALMVQLRLVDETLGLTDPNEIMAAAMKVLQSLDKEYKSAFLHNMSVIVAQVAADGKLTWSDAIILLEWYYKEKYKAA
jgi:hypothetical protein